MQSGEVRLPVSSSFLGRKLAEFGIKTEAQFGHIDENSGLVKQSKSVESLELADLRRTMQTIEQKACAKFPSLDNVVQKPATDSFLIVTAMKNEGPFILEWIAYHLSIGVTHFLVYTNDCTDGTDEILARLCELGFVTHLPNPVRIDKGQKPQRAALNDAVKQEIYQQADWVTCIDVDEFINIGVGDGTLDALFEAAHYPNMISMTWRFFGNGGAVKRYEDKFITEQFTRCAPEFLSKPRLGWGFKTMFAQPSPYKKLGVHRPLQLDETQIDKLRWVNGSGRVMPEMLLTNNGWRSTKRSIGYSMVMLNHYVLRSAESFLVKRDRGRINHVDQDQGVSYWYTRDYTIEEDRSILKRLDCARDLFDEFLRDPKLNQLHQSAVRWHRNKIARLQKLPDYRLLYDKITGALPIDREEIIAKDLETDD